MAEIAISGNEFLKLNNVLCCKVSRSKNETLSGEILSMFDWIGSKGYEETGAVILYDGIQGFDGEGNAITEQRIMIELKNDDVHPESPYYFEKEVSVGNCIRGRFCGAVATMDDADNEIIAYANKNGIEIVNERYTLVHEFFEDGILADHFAPIK